MHATRLRWHLKSGARVAILPECGTEPVPAGWECRAYTVLCDSPP